MKRKNYIFIPLVILSVAVIVLSLLPNRIFSQDQSVDKLLKDIVARAVASLLLLFVAIEGGSGELLKPKPTAKKLLWCLPCLGVALANFPYSALLDGSAHIDRPDLVWLVVLQCFAVAVFEELFFRIIVQSAVEKRFLHRRYGVFVTVVTTSAVFALWHLLNLLYGAGVGATLLQVGYTFLLGCMFSVTLMVTRDFWQCVLLHTLFDIGGTIVTQAGSGSFQDATFWILTAVFGVVCCAHIVASMVFLGKRTAN